MAVSFGAIGVRSYKQAVATTDTVTPALPSGSGAGQLVVFASALQTTTTFASNNGLTKTRQNERVAILEKTVTDLSLESAPTITFGAIVVGDQISAMCLWFPGGATSKDWSDGTGSGTTLTPATLTVSDAGSVGVVFGHQPNDKLGSTFTANSWTEQEYSTSTVGSDATHYVASQDSLTTGAKTMPSWAWVGSLEWRSISFSVPPATGSQAITGALFTNTSTFYGATVGRGAVNIAGSLFSNAQTFYGATIAASYGVAGARFDNTQTFYQATVTPGPVSISGAIYANAQTFYGATVSQASGAQTITAALFTNVQAFFGATVSGESITRDRGDGAHASGVDRRQNRRRSSQNRNANYLDALAARSAPENVEPVKRNKPKKQPSAPPLQEYAAQPQPQHPAVARTSSALPPMDFASREMERSALTALIKAQEDEDEIEVLMLLVAA